MKNWKKVILGVALSFMVFFTAIGYAALTDNLTISGTLNASAPNDIFITKIESMSDAAKTATITGLRSMDATLSGSKNDEVIYAITVKNNTDKTQVYTGSNAGSALIAWTGKVAGGEIYYLSDADAATYVSGTPIKAGGELTFYIKYILPDDVSNESVSVEFYFDEVDYTITYINDTKTLDVRCVLDWTATVLTANDTAAEHVNDYIIAEGLSTTVKFENKWMNAGSTQMDSIVYASTEEVEDVILYPIFDGLHTAIFVDLNGNILAWDTYTATNYSHIVTLGENTIPPAVDYCIFDNWEVHVTNENGSVTATPLSEYKFNDGVDITIYPVYLYQGDVTLKPVDNDGNGITNEYTVTGYRNPSGQAMVVIPENVMGLNVTSIAEGAFASYDGVHSIVIPSTVTYIGDNAFAEKWTGFGDSGETVTIYYAGSYEDWQAKEPNFSNNWESGISDSSRIFFLNGGNMVDVTQGYLQADHSGTGSNKRVSWTKTAVDQDIIDEYTGPCDCAISTTGDTAHIYVDAAGTVLGRNDAGTPVNSDGVVISYGVIKEGFLGIGREYGLTDGTITTYKRYRPDRKYWTTEPIAATATFGLRDETAPEETTAPEEETTAPPEETTAPTEETTAPPEETTAPPEDETTTPEDEATP